MEEVVAGVSAGVSYTAMFWQVVNVATKPGFDWQEAILAEVLCTIVRGFGVLSCATSKKNGCGTGNQFYGLAIGFVIIAGGYGAVHTCGGALGH